MLGSPPWEPKNQNLGPWIFRFFCPCSSASMDASNIFGWDGAPCCEYMDEWDLYGFIWIYMDLYGFLWINMEFMNLIGFMYVKCVYIYIYAYISYEFIWI